MAYETCPQCGARKHQLVACPHCGFKRMTVRPPLNQELLDDSEFPRQRAPAAPPVSSNFETCPNCGERKHLVMACPACGFSRSGNPERLANKPPTALKVRTNETPHRSAAAPPRSAPRSPPEARLGREPQPPTRPYRETSPYHEARPRRGISSDYENRSLDYYGPSKIEQERLFEQSIPVVRWKRPKVAEKRNKSSN